LAIVVTARDTDRIVPERDGLRRPGDLADLPALAVVIGRAFGTADESGERRDEPEAS
jgi:hypothetical protein